MHLCLWKTLSQDCPHGEIRHCCFMPNIISCQTRIGLFQPMCTMSSLIENVCVPLPQCKLLNWMWRHRTEIPKETSENVEKFITSLKCGLPLDVCPKATKIITRDRNPLVKGLRRNQGSFIRNPVKKLGYQQLVDYGCKPFLK